MYQSTKVFGHELGLSACFRQHRATHSHCSLLHGYALSFKFVFQAATLDDRNWVHDFGGLKELKENLQATFDHKLVVAADDPHLDTLCALAGTVADVLVLPAVGCEAFAQHAFHMATAVIHKANKASAAIGFPHDRVSVMSCECAEHGANSAIYFGVMV